MSHLCADHGRFFRTVPALFLYYLTARSCTDLAFLVATGPTPGLCRGVETGPGVALVWDKWSRTSAETPSQNRFWTLGGPMEALGHPTLPLGTPGSSLSSRRFLDSDFYYSSCFSPRSIVLFSETAVEWDFAASEMEKWTKKRYKSIPVALLSYASPQAGHFGPSQCRPHIKCKGHGTWAMLNPIGVHYEPLWAE